MQYNFSDKISTLAPSAIREILKLAGQPGIISFTAGNPSPDSFPVELVRQASEHILKENPIGALQYSITEGHPPLKQAVSDLIKKRYNLGVGDDELIITSGAQQAIDLSTKCLCNEGDTIICENPSFIGSLNAFRSYNVNLVGVDMDNDGINIEGLEQAIAENNNVRILYLIPNFQNPTGITMSAQKRRAVYEIAKKHGIIILEDNPYGDLRFEGTPIDSIKNIDTDGIVIYCGSFSKILSPGLRIGYVLANKTLISKITVAKQVNDVHTNIFSQLICEYFLTHVDFDKHIDDIANLYRKKACRMLSRIDEYFPKEISHTTPQGGLFLWCTLPKEIDMIEFVKRAMEQNVAVVPGSAFGVDESRISHSFRMNFSMPSDEYIDTGVKILGELSHKMIEESK